MVKAVLELVGEQAATEYHRDVPSRVSAHLGTHRRARLTVSEAHLELDVDAAYSISGTNHTRITTNNSATGRERSSATT